MIIVAINVSGQITLINKKGGDILGYSKEKIMGKNWLDTFLLEEIREEVRTVFKKLLIGDIELVEYYRNPVLTREGDKEIIAWHNTVIS